MLTMVVILLALVVCCVSTGCYSAGSGGLLSAMVVVLLALTVCCQQWLLFCWH